MEGYGKRVLVIDDAYDIRYLTSLALSHAGYNVYSAADGSEGLQEMKKRRYDTVLVDYNMPRLNGGQFIEAARVMWPDTPIILMSGDYRMTERVDRVDGIYARVSKPFELPKLCDLIAEACKSNVSCTLPPETTTPDPQAASFDHSRISAASPPDTQDEMYFVHPKAQMQ
jgi:CheY-like chemotaxis protein